jgi:outer membrane protein
MRMRLKKILTIAAVYSLCFTQLRAQEPFVARPAGPIFLRPYKAATPGPVLLSNSDRIRSLIRAGKLYLTLQDTIALAIENNLDLQIDRYGPLNAEWYVERQEAGGPLRGVPAGTGSTNLITSGQGVNGATKAAGLLVNNNSAGGSNNNTTIQQIGTVTPNLDPTFQSASTWSHETNLYPDPVLAGSNSLVDTIHKYANYLQQGLITGGNVQVQANEEYLKENAFSDVLNPSVAPAMSVYIRHNFLQGFGVGVNSRYIKIAKDQVISANVTFKSQLLNLIANVVNQYWGLVADYDDLKAKQDALTFAQNFYRDTQRQIQLGAIAGADIYRAQSEVSTRQQDLAISQQDLSQTENQLKDLISRDGVADPLLAEADIIPLDQIEVPKTDDLPPLRQLVATALANRPDVEIDKINDEVQTLSALGTKNAVLPTLGGYVLQTNYAEAGAQNPLAPFRANPTFIGGLGTAWGQIFRDDFKSFTGVGYLTGPLRNRQAQADYGIDQLTITQGDLVERRNRNQMVVDISNQVIALRQARARYANASDTRALQQDLLDKEQQKFRLGSSTIDNIIAAQRALIAAQYVEISALRTYAQSRVALDQVLGVTLDANHVSVGEALKGKVERPSVLPRELPESPAAAPADKPRQ